MKERKILLTVLAVIIAVAIVAFTPPALESHTKEKIVEAPGKLPGE